MTNEMVILDKIHDEMRTAVAETFALYYEDTENDKKRQAWATAIEREDAIWEAIQALSAWQAGVY